MKILDFQVPGGTMRDSFLVKGVAFKKTFSYAGFEQQRKQFSNPKILLLNVELELKSEKENAEVRWVWCQLKAFTDSCKTCACHSMSLSSLFMSNMKHWSYTYCSFWSCFECFRCNIMPWSLVLCSISFLVVWLWPIAILLPLHWFHYFLLENVSVYIWFYQVFNHIGYGFLCFLNLEGACISRLSDPAQYQSIVDAEWNIIYDKLDKCVKSGAKIVLSRLAIGDLGTQVC